MGVPISGSSINSTIMARKKRPAETVSTGSTADIAFLLLIFFLVTTTIVSDQGLAIQR